MCRVAAAAEEEEKDLAAVMQAMQELNLEAECGEDAAAADSQVLQQQQKPAAPAAVVVVRRFVSFVLSFLLFY